MSSDGWSRGDWMQTATGKQFFPLDPRPEDIDIVDIALALSKICRYGGHCRQFYSVAEHCVLMTRAAPSEVKRWTLLHDASEGYLGDVVRPLKRSLPDYKEIELRLERVIAEKFDLPWPMPALVKELDNRIIHDEYQQNMEHSVAPWSHRGNGLGVELQFWRPTTAAEKFLDLYAELGWSLS
jgi:hypothetical protein